MLKSNLAVGCFVMSAILVAGCGSDGVAELSGTVTIDGQPAPEGLAISFEPTAQGVRGSEAMTDANGHYVARFSISRDGVAVGECVAHLAVGVGGGPMSVPEPGEEVKLPYPAKYYTEIKKFTVEPGSNTVDLELSKTE